MKRQLLIDTRKDVLKMTQLQVATTLGISRTFYNQIENGSRNPNLEIALRISRLFNIPVEKIFKNVAMSNVNSITILNLTGTG